VRLVSFQLGDTFYGVDALHVVEILRAQPITPVPRARSWVAGLINVRGQIITAVDLRRRLGHDEAAGGMNVLVCHGGAAVSLLVDQIGDVLDLDDRKLAPPPDTLPRLLRGFVVATYPFPDRLVLVLDADRTVSNQGEGACA
jgi:purine-binding chemotaxis protein CheW